MCTVVILRRPDHDWPLLLAANRDEMRDRPWRPPARHWPDRPEVVGGLDLLAGGTWLGINDAGLTAAVLNRRGTLGPAAGKRSRGELPLEALDHADAVEAARALADLDGNAYRPFNMIVADNRDAFWIRHAGGRRMEVHDLLPGLSMITAADRNDASDPRIAAYLPRFQAAPAPAPEEGRWDSWQALLSDPGDGGRAAMRIALASGFGTVCGTLIALPAIGREEARPIHLFAAGAPGTVEYRPVDAAPLL